MLILGGEPKNFSLINTPYIYHVNHICNLVSDTLKLSECVAILCWDCESSCPTFYVPISTILSFWVLEVKPAWIYF